MRIEVPEKRKKDDQQFPEGAFGSSKRPGSRSRRSRVIWA